MISKADSEIVCPDVYSMFKKAYDCGCGGLQAFTVELPSDVQPHFSGSAVHLTASFAEGAKAKEAGEPCCSYRWPFLPC